VYRCLDRLFDLFVRTHRVDIVPDHPQRLERHHYLILFAEVADDHEDVVGHW
jgi:hypothetical protein